MDIKKGSLVTITNGEYSDYGVIGLVRALEDLDIEALKQEYLKQYPDQAERYTADFYKFVHWLTNVRAAAEEVRHFGWHLGSYEFEFDLEDIKTRIPDWVKPDRIIDVVKK